MSSFDFDAFLEPTPEVMCGIWLSSPGTWSHPLLLGYHSLLWVIDGSAVIECDDGERFEVPPNGVYYAPPDIEYTVRWDAHRMTRWGWLNFIPDGIRDLPRLRLSRADDIVVPLFNHMLALSMERPPDWETSIRTVRDYALQIFATGHASTLTGSVRVSSEIVARALATLQRRWDRSVMSPVSAAQLAADVGVTTRHLSRVFERELGVGPVTMIRTIRILKAAELLTGTGHPIREIAGYVGFASQYHFAAAFKAMVGVPPGEYRIRPLERIPVSPQLEQLSISFPTPKPGRGGVDSR